MSKMTALQTGRQRIGIIKKIDIWCFFIFLILMDYPLVDSRTEMVFKGGIMIIMLCFAAIGKSHKFLFRDGWPIIPYALIIVISSAINRGLSEAFYRACIYAMLFISVYWFIGLMARRYGVEETMQSLFRVLCFIVIVADTIVILTNGKGLDSSVVLPNYLVGNKFFVAYLNMLCFSLYLHLKRKAHFRNAMILLVLMILVCLRAGSATGAIGLISVALFFFLIPKIALKLTSTPIFLGALALSSVLVTSFNAIISNPVVANFITNVLHRSLTMTGRMEIYEILVPIFNQSPWIGHGYNNSIVWDTVGYGNPQNGIWDILINYGVVGLVLFVALCLITIKSVKKNSYKQIFPIMCFLYGMIVCATVEICLTYFFIMGLAIVRIFGTNINKSDDSSENENERV